MYDYVRVYSIKYTWLPCSTYIQIMGQKVLAQKLFPRVNMSKFRKWVSYNPTAPYTGRCSLGIVIVVKTWKPKACVIYNRFVYVLEVLLSAKRHHIAVLNNGKTGVRMNIGKIKFILRVKWWVLINTVVQYNQSAPSIRGESAFNCNHNQSYISTEHHRTASA
jgi:hypothetical protein